MFLENTKQNTKEMSRFFSKCKGKYEANAKDFEGKLKAKYKGIAKVFGRKLQIRMRKEMLRIFRKTHNKMQRKG